MLCLLRMLNACKSAVIRNMLVVCVCVCVVLTNCFEDVGIKIIVYSIEKTHTVNCFFKLV